jgi:hypothetical protein
MKTRSRIASLIEKGEAIAQHPFLFFKGVVEFKKIGERYIREV